MNRYAGLAIAGAVALAVAACGGEEAPPAETGTEVSVTMTDFHLELGQTSFEPGSYTFVGTNEGQAPHALEVEGGGVEQKTETVGPGGSVELTVTLEEGEYELYCPVGNHKGQGMTTKVTVG